MVYRNAPDWQDVAGSDETVATRRRAGSISHVISHALRWVQAIRQRQKNAFHGVLLLLQIEGM
jgi:hypothetical protein